MTLNKEGKACCFTYNREKLNVLTSPAWNCIPVESSFGKSGVHLTHEPLAYPGVSSEMYMPDWGEYSCGLKCNRFLREEDAWTPFVFIALQSVDSDSIWVREAEREWMCKWSPEIKIKYKPMCPDLTGCLNNCLGNEHAWLHTTPIKSCICF